MKTITEHEFPGLNEALTITANDDPEHGACNNYSILYTQGGAPAAQTICFQNGPITEAGVNGISMEALLAIILDRMRDFQQGSLSCRDNALVITHLEDALMRLHKRAHDRLERGVEGTMQP